MTDVWSKSFLLSSDNHLGDEFVFLSETSLVIINSPKTTPHHPKARQDVNDPAIKQHEYLLLIVCLSVCCLQHRRLQLRKLQPTQWMV